MNRPAVAASAATIRAIEVRACLSDPVLGVMNIPNEVMLDYPDAISFAPGPPPQQFFGVGAELAALPQLVADTAARSGRTAEQVWQEVGQYNRTNGVIAEALAAHLLGDEGIRVPRDAIMVTVGAQEAMAIVLTGLFDPSHDVLLATDPTDIGITAFARLLGIRVVPIASTDEGLTAAAVDAAIRAAASIGRVRAVYTIPDFNNPLGTTMPLDERRALLDVCSRHGTLLIEDNAYGMFAYDAEPADAQGARPRRHGPLHRQLLEDALSLAARRISRRRPAGGARRSAAREGAVVRQEPDDGQHADPVAADRVGRALQGRRIARGGRRAEARAPETES